MITQLTKVALKLQNKHKFKKTKENINSLANEEEECLNKINFPNIENILNKYIYYINKK